MWATLSSMNRALLVIVSAFVLALIGCGGSGGGETRQKLTREQVESLVIDGIAGIQRLPSGPGSGSPTPAVGPTGKSGIKARTSTRSRGPGEVYWNGEYELWAVDFMDGDPSVSHTWGTHFFLDEAASIPAGDDVWQSQWSGWPQTDDQSLAITGGPWAGLSTNTHIVFNQDGRGLEEGNGFVPGEGNWEYTMSWVDGGYATIDAKYTDLENTWVRYQAEPNEDGSQRYTITTSAGVKTVMLFDADYAGTGTITGPSAALPASMEWDANGDGLITWADGSTTPFSIWEF